MEKSLACEKKNLKEQTDKKSITKSIREKMYIHKQTQMQREGG